jgi:protein disulfide-isomerase
MRFTCLLSFIVCVTTRLSALVHWQTDYVQALSQSQSENKPMFLFFNGSDWVGSAMKLKHEVLDTPTFQKKIGTQFVFMEVDFPKYSALQEALAAQNESLKNRFKIEEFPSLLLLDVHERVITKISYIPENVEQLANDLLKIMEQDAELNTSLKQIQVVSCAQLQQLYQTAQDLGNIQAIEKILETGLKKEDPFFYLEKYRLLVENGEMKSEQAVVLRQKLLSFCPAGVHVNGQSIPFTVALIDFQEISQKNPESDLAAEPLIDYLTHFGVKEPQNVWQIEMMLSKIYLDCGKWNEALRHAEKAYSSAPESMHTELAHTLDYIRAAQKATVR